MALPKLGCSSIFGVGQADDAGCDLNGHCPREVVQSEDRVALLAANDDLHRRATFVLEHDRLRQGAPVSFRTGVAHGGYAKKSAGILSMKPKAPTTIMTPID